MSCGKGETAGCKWGSRKGLREGRNLKKSGNQAERRRAATRGRRIAGNVRGVNQEVTPFRTWCRAVSRCPPVVEMGRCRGCGGTCPVTPFTRTQAITSELPTIRPEHHPHLYLLSFIIFCLRFPQGRLWILGPVRQLCRGLAGACSGGKFLVSRPGERKDTINKLEG